MKDATIGLILLKAVEATCINAEDRHQLYINFADGAYPSDSTRAAQLLRSLCANDVKVVEMFEAFDAADIEEESE